MKLPKKTIKKILSDDVLIYAHRRNLWKNGVTPNPKLSDEVLQFLTFLESHNHLLDFIDLHNRYSETIIHNDFGIIAYNKNEGTISEYFRDRPQRFYLRGAYRWYLPNYKHLWEGLEEEWKQIINK